MANDVLKMGEIIPFGKYRGQPVEVMLADSNYCEWLTAQDWFKRQFQPIYNVVVQGVSEPQDSPEHNAMQARFLDVDYQTRFLDLLGVSATSPVHVTFEAGTEQMDVLLYMREGLLDGGALAEDMELWAFDTAVEIKPTIGDDFPTILRQIKTKAARRRERLLDDKDRYVHKIRPVDCWVAAYDRFTATTVTVEQVAAMFAPIKLVCVAGL